MTNEHVRSLVAQLVIAASLCVGINAMVAGPLRARALGAEAELAGFIDRNDTNAGAIAVLARVVDGRQQSDAAAEAFDARNRPALDEAAMFSQVLGLGTRSGVTVEQVIPGGEGKSDAGTDAASKPRPKDRRVRHTLVGGGSYAATAEFLELLQGEWAHCAVRQCRITPDYQSKKGDAVRFTMLIELFSFDASPIDLTAGTEGAP